MLKGRRGGSVTPEKKAELLWIEEMGEIRNAAHFLVHDRCKGATKDELKSVMDAFIKILDELPTTVGE